MQVADRVLGAVLSRRPMYRTLELGTLGGLGLHWVYQVSEQMPCVSDMKLAPDLLAHCVPLLTAESCAVFLDFPVELGNFLA